MSFTNNLSLADLHCDTPNQLYLHSQSFFNNSLSVSNHLTDKYLNYLQIAAIWSQTNLDNDTAYEEFFRIAKYFRDDIARDRNVSVYKDNSFLTKKTFILAVEDARILNGQLDRLDLLYNEGVRVLTLLWGGCTCIGGAHDTSEGLTDFGKAVVKKSINLGIIPDISHASDKSASEIFEICGCSSPIIASHSCSRAVFAHTRNITDEQFGHIKESGGVVGINLYLKPLGLEIGDAAIPQILKHIEHFLDIGGEDVISLGCDFDGTDPPCDLKNISLLTLLAEEMQKINYSEEIIRKLFYNNVNNFINKHIIK